MQHYITITDEINWQQFPIKFKIHKNEYWQIN